LENIDNEIAVDELKFVVFKMPISKHIQASVGVVNLPKVRRHDCRCDERSESSRRILGDFGDVAPRDKSRGELFSIK
jgi:hypothetical protein